MLCNDVPRYYESRRDWTDLTCSVCKHDYDGATSVALGEIGLAKIEEADEVDEDELSLMLSELGWAYRSFGDANRARELLERALATRERVYGVDHIETSKTRFFYAQALRGLHLSENAVREMAQAAGGLGNAFGADHHLARKAANLATEWGASRQSGVGSSRSRSRSRRRVG